MDETDRPDDRRAAGSWVLPNGESRRPRNHEAAKSGIPKRKKTTTPAFLQNRILAHVKSPRRINRFRILHGRLSCAGGYRMTRRLVGSATGPTSLFRFSI